MHVTLPGEPMRSTHLCAAALLVAVPSAARAQATEGGRLELGAVTGAYLFSADSELGVNDSMEVPALRSFALFGLRLGWALTPRWSIEGEVVAIPTRDDGPGRGALVTGE